MIGGKTYYQPYEGLLVIDAIETFTGSDADVSDVHVEPAGREGGQGGCECVEPAGRGYECVLRECVFVFVGMRVRVCT